MTHEQRFRELLAAWGIIPSTNEMEWDLSEHRVVLAAREGNVEGYMGFGCIVEFNDDGSFKDMGVWE